MNVSAMYSLKPIYGNKIDLHLSNCMYKMDNVHTSQRQNAPHGDCVGVATEDDDNPLTALERRQDKIIARLEELKCHVNNLLETASDVKQTSSSSVKMVLECHDIVINVNPKQPPLSVFALHHLLTPRVHCFTSVYVHSSVIGRVEDTHCFVNGCKDRSNAELIFTLIWKDVCHGPEMIIHPISQSTIYGEANIARYLSRILNPNYEVDPVLATQIDTWLDLATNLLISGSTKEKASVLKTLNSHLGKHDWLVGSSLSLADIVTWSAIIQSALSNAAPTNVKKWLKACEDTSAFQFAKQFIN